MKIDYLQSETLMIAYKTLKKKRRKEERDFERKSLNRERSRADGAKPLWALGPTRPKPKETNTVPNSFFSNSGETSIHLRNCWPGLSSFMMAPLTRSAASTGTTRRPQVRDLVSLSCFYSLLMLSPPGSAEGTRNY